VVFGIAIYIGYGMFTGSGDEMAETAKKNLKPNPDIPKPATLLTNMNSRQQQPLSAADLKKQQDMQKIQDYLQSRYIYDMAQLQILKVEKDIEDTNKDIAKARLDTITAQKKAVEMFPQPTMVAPSSYAKSLEQGPSGPSAKSESSKQPTQAFASVGEYTVVSVSRLRGEWTAVLGYQGTLYSVRPGDIVAADGSVVLSIDKSGVLLEKDKTKIKVPMAQII
jgi:hypothetical protein